MLIRLRFAPPDQRRDERCPLNPGVSRQQIAHMSEPKLHHYVPQFYLKYFCDQSDRIWVWDKKSQKAFQTTSNRVAAGTHFYRVPEFIGTEVDPLFLENDLANLEGKAASILRSCIELFATMQPMDYLDI